jgi:hypothetical protein
MKLLPEAKLRIIIVDDSTNQVCTGNCDIDWSSAETLGRINQQVIDRFGSNIDINYIDLSKATDKEVQQFRPLVDNTTIPVLLINNKPRIVGKFDSRQLMDAIEVELEGGLYEYS